MAVGTYRHRVSMSARPSLMLSKHSGHGKGTTGAPGRTDPIVFVSTHRDVTASRHCLHSSLLTVNSRTIAGPWECRLSMSVLSGWVRPRDQRTTARPARFLAPIDCWGWAGNTRTAFVQVGGKATVQAGGKATVQAGGKATGVQAGGKATVQAGGKATGVQAGGKATVQAGAKPLVSRLGARPLSRLGARPLSSLGARPLVSRLGARPLSRLGARPLVSRLGARPLSRLGGKATGV